MVSCRRCPSACWLPKLSNRKIGLIIASGRWLFALVCEELVILWRGLVGPLLRNILISSSRMDDGPSNVSLPIINVAEFDWAGTRNAGRDGCTRSGLHYNYRGRSYRTLLLANHFSSQCISPINMMINNCSVKIFRKLVSTNKYRKNLHLHFKNWRSAEISLFP